MIRGERYGSRRGTAFGKELLAGVDDRCLNNRLRLSLADGAIPKQMAERRVSAAAVADRLAFGS